MGYVYLLHFERPISAKHTTQHYIGYAEDVKRRVQRHHRGKSSARLLEVAKERSIDFAVVRIWENVDRNFERKIKNQHKHRRHCPICRGEMSYEQALHQIPQTGVEKLGVGNG